MTDPIRLPPDTLRDHEERIRSLERERVTDQRLSAIEKRVHALELTAAKAVVVMGAVSFMASAVASGLVALVFNALSGK